jgi:hypothetical protein
MVRSMIRPATTTPAETSRGNPSRRPLAKPRPKRRNRHFPVIRFQTAIISERTARFNRNDLSRGDSCPCGCIISVLDYTELVASPTTRRSSRNVRTSRLISQNARMYVYRPEEIGTNSLCCNAPHQPDSENPFCACPSPIVLNPYLRANGES